LKGQGPKEDQIKWDAVIQRKRPSFDIVLRKESNKGFLSQRELEVLEESRVTINTIRGSISDWLHTHCPEWKNPGRSSAPIDPSTILRLSKKSEEEIHRLEEANEEIRFINSLLSAR
jgi:hypothetical protein